MEINSLHQKDLQGLRLEILTMLTTLQHSYFAFILAFYFLHYVHLQDLCAVKDPDYEWDCQAGPYTGYSLKTREICTVKCKTPDPSCVVYKLNWRTGEFGVHECPRNRWRADYGTCGCPRELGYRLRVVGTTVRCILVAVGQYMNYSKAKDYCSSRDGRLIKAYTNQMIVLVIYLAFESGMKTNTNRPRIWIGLDDIKKENSFVWTDGTAMTKDERKKLFVIRNPNNGGRGGNQDCVSTHHMFAATVDDYYCEYNAVPCCEHVMS